DDPWVIAWPGPVEEGLPVLAQREEGLGRGGPDGQEEDRGEEPDLLSARQHGRPSCPCLVLTATPRPSVAPERMPRQRSGSCRPASRGDGRHDGPGGGAGGVPSGAGPSPRSVAIMSSICLRTPSSLASPRAISSSPRAARSSPCPW